MELLGTYMRMHLVCCIVAPCGCVVIDIEACYDIHLFNVFVVINDWINISGEFNITEEDNISVDSEGLCPVDLIKSELCGYYKFLKVAQLNVRSLPKHVDELRCLIYNVEFDVFAITESWLNDNVPNDRVNISGYDLVRADRKHKKGGGVCAYIKHNIAYKIIKTNYSEIEPELLWVEVIPNDNTKIAIGILYKAPSVSYTKYKSIVNVVDYIKSRYTHVILVGDFNVNMLIESPAKNFLNTHIINPLCLTQLLHMPTRIGKDTESLIDLMLVLHPEFVMKVDAVDMPGIADHFLTYMVYSLKLPKFKPKLMSKRKFKSIDIEKFNVDADNAPWENTYVVDDINDKLLIFENIIMDLLNKHAPVCVFRVTRPPAPWMTEEIKQLMFKRDKLKLKYNKSKRTDNNAFDNYKILKNKVNLYVRRAKLNYFDKTINKKIKNTKEYWAALKRLRVIDCEDESGIGFSAQALNDYFLLNNNAQTDLELINNEIDSLLSTDMLPPSFYFTSVHELEVIKCLRSITTKATGVDAINVDVLKLCMPYCVFALTHIINSSFETQTFPNKWKRALITPVKKCSVPEGVSDYRPVSILTTLSKVIEKIAVKQLTNYLTSNHLFDPLQSGFKKHHSTSSALIKVTGDMVSAMEQKHVTVLVLLDYSKAFDTVNHSLLLAKMKKMGIGDSALLWFGDYLSERCQRVVTNTDESTWGKIFNGVPQGSVLGPLLFSILISDISKCIDVCKYHLYADDTQLYHHSSVNSLGDAIPLINHELNSIATFSKNNGLRLNAKKNSLYNCWHK